MEGVDVEATLKMKINYKKKTEKKKAKSNLRVL